MPAEDRDREGARVNSMRSSAPILRRVPNTLRFGRFRRRSRTPNANGSRQRGGASIEMSVIPAFRRLRDFYEKRYLPVAAKDIAASALPPGQRYYEARLAFYTTTRMTPREIHELGLAEVARIGSAMDATVAAAGFAGTRAEFQRSINTDPRFFYTRAEDMLAGYRDIAKRADAELPRFFAVLPRLPYGIRRDAPGGGRQRRALRARIAWRAAGPAISRRT